MTREEIVKQASIVVLMDKTDENCQLDLWGKAAYETKRNIL
jgi:hypothetical protein